MSRQELESLIADYATGMLDKGLRTRVEASLPAYPDLQSEAIALRNDLALLAHDTHVSRDARNAELDHATRNLSVYVVDALERNTRKSAFRHLAWVIPSAATAVLLIVFTFGAPDAAIDVAESTRLGTSAAETTVTQAATSTQGSIESTEATMQDTFPRVTATTKSKKRNDQGPQTQRDLVREELIVADLVSEQIIDRMAADVPADPTSLGVNITDEELDVLLASVTANETL